jgi:hypothetical protein
MTESWRHYTKGSKPDKEGQILYGFIYMECKEYANL